MICAASPFFLVGVGGGGVGGVRKIPLLVGD